MIRLFLDVNVLLDVLVNREPWVDDSARVLSLVDEPGVEGLVAAHSITTVHYLAGKHLGNQRAVGAIIGLLEHVSITPLDGDLLVRALSLGWSDVEDAVQWLSAERAGADYLVTRNPSDFEARSMPVLTPRQLLAALDATP